MYCPDIEIILLLALQLICGIISMEILIYLRKLESSHVTLIGTNISSDIQEYSMIIYPIYLLSVP